MLYSAQTAVKLCALVTQHLKKKPQKSGITFAKEILSMIKTIFKIYTCSLAVIGGLAVAAIASNFKEKDKGSFTYEDMGVAWDNGFEAGLRVASKNL